MGQPKHSHKQKMRHSLFHYSGNLWDVWELWEPFGYAGISGAYFGHACWLYSERREVTQYVRFFLSVQTIRNGSQEGSSNVEKHFPNCYADDNSNSSSQKVHKKFVKN